MKTIDLLMDELKLTAAEVARRAGISTERMEAVAAGRWTPSSEDRVKIAAALGVAVEDVSWGHTMNPRNVRYHRFGLKENF